MKKNATKIKNLTRGDTETKSHDIVAENVGKLKALFPEAIAEGKINFDVLKQLLGGAVDERDEKYGLNWYGKRKARQLALTSSTGTLRPCPEDSVDWDTTKNLMIEGDNLEVLKLLQKSYSGKVKLIYIDPPYNTGKDFVYSDDFQDNIKNYLELTGQLEGGRKISSNTESSGRFHTDWLNMMYPRLKVARNLLSEDGVIFISIDEREIANLRFCVSEVFGIENSIAEFIWQAKKGGGSDNSGVVSEHEYVVCYAKNVNANPLGQMLIEAEALDKEDKVGPYRRGRELNKWGANSLRKDRPTMYFPIPGPGGVDVFPIRNDGKEGCWRWGKIKLLEASKRGNLEFEPRKDGTYIVYEKNRSTESRSKPHRTILDDCGQTADGTKVIKELFNEKVFDFTKPIVLISKIIEIGAPLDDDDTEHLILDFFAGSGTTGHAAMLSNVESNIPRKFILVQLPEPLDSENKDQLIAAEFCKKISKPQNIAELTKERLRRAGKKIKEGNPLFAGDLGFRVFKLDSSNIRAWEPDRENLTATLEEAVDHLKAKRTESDILYELLLKLGLDLTVPIEQKKITGKVVHSIGAGTLMVCLSEKITAKEVEPLALGIVEWHKILKPAGETSVVFRDSAFADDVAKTNLTAILSQHGLENIRSL